MGLDNFITGSPDNIAISPATSTSSSCSITSRHTRTSPVRWRCAAFRFPGQPHRLSRAPDCDLKVGALGTHNALGLAKAKSARFFLASTSEVYGDPLVHPQPESYWGNVNPIGPRGVYDEAKRFAEAMTMAYHARTTSIRASCAFSTPTAAHAAARRARRLQLHRAGASWEPITIYGDGTQTRSFCYVDDEVEGIYRLFMRGDSERPTSAIRRSSASGSWRARRRAHRDTVADRAPTLPQDDPKVRHLISPALGACSIGSPTSRCATALRARSNTFAASLTEPRPSADNGR